MINFRCQTNSIGALENKQEKYDESYHHIHNFWYSMQQRSYQGLGVQSQGQEQELETKDKVKDKDTSL